MSICFGLLDLINVLRRPPLEYPTLGKTIADFCIESMVDPFRFNFPISSPTFLIIPGL